MKLIIDVNNIYHRDYHIVIDSKKLDINDKESQEILIDKFIDSIERLCNGFNKLFPYFDYIVCIDSSSFRKTLYKEYKGNRKRKQDAFYHTLDICEEVLRKNKKYKVLRIDSLEADDLLMLCREKFKEDYKILVSNDGDIRQLVDETTFVYTANSLNMKLYCKNKLDVPENLSDELHDIVTEIDPDFVKFEKLMLGCKGDNIPRLLPPRNGMKKVERIYNNYIRLKDLQKSLHVNNFPNIKDEDIKFQKSLVYLEKQYIPEGKIEEFEENIF